MQFAWPSGLISSYVFGSGAAAPGKLPGKYRSIQCRHGPLIQDNLNNRDVVNRAGAVTKERLNLLPLSWALISIQHWGGPLIKAPKAPRSNAEGVRIEAP